MLPIHIERDLAREAALDAVARIDRNRFDIELPPDGRIEAAHLRRFHPEASAALREALDRAASGSPELAGALERHRKAVERCAGLKCLAGEARDAYARKEAADLGLRCENAALRVLVPDRTPTREEMPTRRAAPGTGPAVERRREAGLATEARSCIPRARLERIARKAARGRDLEPADLRGCPSADRAFRHAPSPGPALGRAAAVATLVAREAARDAGGRDMGDEAGERALRLIAVTLRILASGGTGPSSVPALKIANRIERTITR